MMHSLTPKTPQHRHCPSNPALPRSPSPQVPPRPRNQNITRPQKTYNGMLETKDSQPLLYPHCNQTSIKESRYYKPV